jgi:predicted ribosome quality control (RQC) complex YloA/Tae2 family protein
MRFLIGSYYVNIGKSAKENWKLLDDSHPNDIWFHLDKVSSPYVILESKNSEDIPQHIIYECAKLCKSHSKQKNLTSSSIIYCSVGNIKKAKAVGSVNLIKPCSTIKVYQ